MKEDYSSQLDDYDEPFCEQQYMHGSCLFVYSNSNPLISVIPPSRLTFTQLWYYSKEVIISRAKPVHRAQLSKSSFNLHVHSFGVRLAGGSNCVFRSDALYFKNNQWCSVVCRVLDQRKRS